MLLNSILKADFLVGLIFLREVSTLLHPVSLSLQRENVDLVQALADIEDLITVLKQWRTEAEQEFSRRFREVNELASSLGVTIEKPRTVALLDIAVMHHPVIAVPLNQQKDTFC